MLVNEKKIIVCSDLFLYKYLRSKFGTYIGHLNTILALGGGRDLDKLITFQRLSAEGVYSKEVTVEPLN